MDSKEWGEMIAKEIKDGNIYGSSFTKGAALYRIIKRALLAAKATTRGKNKKC